MSGIPPIAFQAKRYQSAVVQPRPEDLGDLRIAMRGILINHLLFGRLGSSDPEHPDQRLLAICARHGVNASDRTELNSFFQALIELADGPNP